MFRLFADLIAFHLEAHGRLAASEASLLSERQTAELREQFIAVLSHDLRNPLASIDAGARLLSRSPLNDQDVSILDRMRLSVRRMSAMIDDVADLARCRLGGGMVLDLTKERPLAPVLEQVIAELRAAHPQRRIDAELGPLNDVQCDPGRMGQMLSNLLANALTHGDPGAPVRVIAGTRGDEFELSVANAGSAIPEVVAENIFKPFFRAGARRTDQGLGLGLYIASEIARAHAGTLTVVSDGAETRFTFRVPAN